MRYLTECLVCHGTRFKTVLESTFSGTPLEAAPYFLAHRRGVVRGQIQRCHTCGFRFTNPQFEPGEYDLIYQNAPRAADSAIALDAGDGRRFRRLAQCIQQDTGARGRFLDFGCGSGGFLAAVDDPLGSGFEVGAPATFTVGRSQITTGRLADVLGTPGFAPGSFDLITSFDVFEHLPELDRYVQALAGLLKPGGHLVLTVPDAGSWNARLAGGRWNMYLLEHLWYFNQRTLRAYMQRAGFREITHRTLPYDAPVAHIVRRVTQTYGLPAPSFGPRLSSLVFPVPIGILYAAFRLEG